MKSSTTTLQLDQLSKFDLSMTTSNLHLIPSYYIPSHKSYLAYYLIPIFKTASRKVMTVHDTRSNAAQLLHPKEFNTWRTSTSCTTLVCPWHCLRRRISEEQSTRFDTILTAYSVPVLRSTHLRHTLKLPSPKMASLRSISYRWKKGEFWKEKY